VVFKFTSFGYNGLGSGVIQFTPHPSGAPVVILVQQDVSINNGGTLYLQGSNGNGYALAAAPPGGFRGGAAAFGSLPGAAGFGPGGGNYDPISDPPGSGSFATSGTGPSGALYGNASIIPLIGGSGGAGRYAHGYGGASGGGAIMIAAQGTISLTSGRIYAYGGSSSWSFGGGSGGAIRLIGNTVIVDATSTLAANGVAGGGDGRIRVEANTRTLSGSVVPPPSAITPNQTPQIWPDSTTPRLEIVSVGGTNAPADPRPNLFQPDIELNEGGQKTVVVHAYNVPTDGTWQVQVRLTPRNGKESFVTCTYVSGNQGSSIWQGSLNFDVGSAAMIARAHRL